ncbi:MAG: protein kinase [Ardenticatenaceae bacterium]|nr:protein kinase [Ardenticatenaceae bacterium]MCB9446644.1 protein kinase [Ardenticatenaceae bacterium]
MTDPLIGQTLGKYTIKEKIGRGGMADVYKAYQENLGRFVAVKVMHSFLIDFEEENFLKRFSREARTMASLNHSNIVRVYDFDSFGPRSHYLVMDYVGGGSLKDKLESLAAKGERMSLAQSIQIITKIADALAYAHRRDMVHRDIKPANILLDNNGEPFLTDFGIVKMVGGQTMGYTATGALIGTPAYMSPEQALGKPGDKRSDLYSLGIMLFQMVTGKLPFDADTPLGVAMKHVSEQVPLPIRFNPDVPEILQSIILKALAKEPNDRFQSAEEMVAALRQIDLAAQPKRAFVPPASLPPAPKTEVLPPEPTRPTSLPATEVLSPPVKKRRWPLWAGLALLLVAIIVATAVLLPRLKSANQLAAATATPSSTPPPTDTAVPTNTLVPEDTPDYAATAVAIIVLTSEAQSEPQEIEIPTATPSPTGIATKAAAPTNTARPTATSTATSTATRAGNSTGTAQTGGGLPNGFETFGTWVRGDEDNGTFTQSTTQVHGGSYGGKLSYEFGSSGNDYVVFLQLNSISGTPNTIQIWVYGDGSGHFLNAWILDSAGETWQVPLGRVTHTGWQQMTGYIATGQDWPWGHISGPSNDKVDYPLTFRGLVLDDVNNSYTGSGNIYVDDLTATTSNLDSIPTAQPVLPANPTATTAVTTNTTNTGNVGRIIYTSGSSLLTTDPAWSAPQELGSYASDSCNSPATTVAGQSFNLYYGNYCGIGATGTGVCKSPNSQYEVVTNHDNGSYSIVVRPTGSEELRFVYQGSLDLAEGIRWSPLSDSFLFVIDDTVNRAFLGGNYMTIGAPANTPIFSPDGSQILFRRPVGPGVNDIFVSNADGTNLRNVTNVTAVDKRCAAWRK